MSKVWFITGTSSGFGKRLVSAVLDRGDSVVATARSLQNIEDLKARHRDCESRLGFLQLDITDPFEIIKARIDEGIALWGRIDVLVNNAGVGLPGLVEEFGAELLQKQFDTNVFGVAKVNTAVLPHMRERGSGTLVIVGSRSAWKTDVTGIGAYAASKAAVHAMSETLAHELTPFGVRVLIVEPGGFRTENIYNYPWSAPHHQASLDEYRSKYESAWYSIPGKQLGDPGKAAAAIVDVVRGEGKAKGKEFPLWLVLGPDAEKNIRDKCNKVVQNLDDWQEVVRGTNFD